MDQDTKATDTSDHREFRRYRQALIGIYFLALTLGVSLVLASLVYDLFLRRGPRAPAPTVEARVRCNDEVRELLEDLGKTAASLQAQAAAGDPDERGTRWDEFSRAWDARWEAVNVRCQFDHLADTGLGKAYDRMAWVHRSLPTLKLKYRDMMKRFAADQAQELAEMRRALDASSAELHKRAGGVQNGPGADREPEEQGQAR